VAGSDDDDFRWRLLLVLAALLDAAHLVLVPLDGLRIKGDIAIRLLGGIRVALEMVAPVVQTVGVDLAVPALVHLRGFVRSVMLLDSASSPLRRHCIQGDSRFLVPLQMLLSCELLFAFVDLALVNALLDTGILILVAIVELDVSDILLKPFWLLAVASSGTPRLWSMNCRIRSAQPGIS
jgi:hypothetical protein